MSKQHRLWMIFFGCWALFLSGVFASFIGSPGVIQAVRLQSLLSSKQGQIQQIQAELTTLEHQASRLEKNKAVQQREIRRVLGYAASDELIFDFGDAESSE